MSQQMKELRNKNREELAQMAEETQKEIFHLRNELKSARKLEKPHMIKEMRKKRARILTLLNEKEDTQ